MHARISAAMVLIFLTTAAIAQCPDTLLTRIYDLPNNVGALGAFDMILTEDGGAIACGYVGFWPTSQVWIARTDSLGDTLWTRSFGEPDLNETCFSIIAASESTFVIAGLRGWGDNEEPGDSSVTLVLKINHDGDTIWTNTYSWGRTVMGREVIRCDAGGYAVAGSTNYWEDFYYEPTPDALASDMYLLRISETGDSLWSHSYGGWHGDEAFSLVQTAGGEFVMAGVTGSFGDTLGDVYLVQTDSVGMELWSNTYGHPGVADVAESIVATEDDGFLLTGIAFIPPASEAYVIRVNSGGVLVWDTTYRRNAASHAYDLIALPGDSFVTVLATSTSFADGHPYVIWAEPNGVPYRECDYFLDGADQVYPYGMVLSPSGEYGFCGVVYDQLYAAFQLRTQIDPLSANEQLPSVPQKYAASIYPNPFNSVATIRLEIPIGGRTSVSLFDLLGREVEMLLDRNLLPGTHYVIINGTILPSGLYFVSIQTEHYWSIEKAMLLR